MSSSSVHQASAEGTQAKLLVAAHGFTHLSTGDALRNVVSQRTPLGLRAQTIIDRGDLVPDELVTEILSDLIALYRPDTESFLFDGYPRTLPQVASLDAICTQFNLMQPKVVYLDVDEARLVARLSGRRVCSKCKTTYNINFSPPSKAETCDNCGASLIQRPDDRAETVRERLRVYRELTRPVFEAYRDRSWMTVVDGVGRTETVFERIEVALGMQEAK